MRDLVTGGAACAVPGSSSSSNPIGALASAVLGTSYKAQELKGLPGASLTVPGTSMEYRPESSLAAIPGSEQENLQYQPDGQSSQFMRGFHSADQGVLADAWNDVQQPVVPHSQGRGNQNQFAEFEQIYNHAAGSSQVQHSLDGPPQRVLSNFLHSFMESSRAGIPFHPAPLPVLGLSKGDKQCIRDRSCIMARHIFADKSEDYINAQVNALLHSLDIDSDDRMKGPMHGMPPELEEYWTESQLAMKPGMMPADRWVAEYDQQKGHNDPDAWADSFERMHGANGWASEFEKEQTQMTSLGQIGGPNLSNIAAMEQTRMLAHTLSQNADPKFQNSRFLQFVSKMSRGELIVDDNQIKPASGSLSGDWADEFQSQYSANPSSWADQFAQEQLSRGADAWVDDFTNQQRHGATDDQWVNEFSKLHVDDDWADEFGRQVGEGALDGNDWVDSYDQFIEEQSVAFKQRSESSRGVYVFSDMNPYVGHPDPLREGQELFRKGLLSEAVLALEAEVLKNPNNAEGWRLLGVTHAENDDDQQAIASMMRAHEADPTNLEVLLALGVSHTNELEQAEALKYLYGWLKHHPKYGSFASPGVSESPFHTDVTRAFNEASEMAPEDADVYIVLGVLYNLSREYDRAIESFKKALKLKPHDYSLWNKLGATQANSVLSADAILAYQQALDLKPNYVRAWANMGISYANQGLYEESIRYYVRALAMNPKADSAWQYLRLSLSCASRSDLIPACDARNIDLLQKEFPL